MRASFWSRLLDTIAPRTCPVCGGRLSANESIVCASCHMHMPLTNYEKNPFDNPMARLFWGRFPIEKAAAMFFYEPQGNVSRIIYEMKYHGKIETCQYMGEIMARRMAAAGFFDGIEAIVPMPLNWRRQWKRGYNQSMEIARGINSVTALPIYNNVVKRRHFSKSQTTLHNYERMKNVENAFSLTKADKISGRHILLIDDIVTTGSTITACAKELAKASVASISLLTVGITKS
ncbi:MAG: ComF family protein [Prevotella sp.]|nr:ComF family protein [Prevotella sp.]